MEEMWLTRDENDTLALWRIKPKKYVKSGYWNNPSNIYEAILDKGLFPEVKWSDEKPTKVKLVIDK